MRRPNLTPGNTALASLTSAGRPGYTGIAPGMANRSVLADIRDAFGSELGAGQQSALIGWLCRHPVTALAYGGGQAARPGKAAQAQVTDSGGPAASRAALLAWVRAVLFWGGRQRGGSRLP